MTIRQSRFECNAWVGASVSIPWGALSVRGAIRWLGLSHPPIDVWNCVAVGFYIEVIAPRPNAEFAQQQRAPGLLGFPLV